MVIEEVETDIDYVRMTLYKQETSSEMFATNLLFDKKQEDTEKLHIQSFKLLLTLVFTLIWDCLICCCCGRGSWQWYVRHNH